MTAIIIMSIAIKSLGSAIFFKEINSKDALYWSKDMLQNKIITACLTLWVIKKNPHITPEVLNSSPSRLLHILHVSLWLTHLIQIISLLEVRSVHELCSDWHAPYTGSIAPYTGSIAPIHSIHCCSTQGPLLPTQGPLLPTQGPLLPTQCPLLPTQGSIAPYTTQGPLLPTQGPLLPTTGSIAPTRVHCSYTGSIAPYTGPLLPTQGPCSLHCVHCSLHRVIAALHLAHFNALWWNIYVRVELEIMEEYPVMCTSQGHLRSNRTNIWSDKSNIRNMQSGGAEDWNWEPLY